MFTPLDNFISNGASPDEIVTHFIGQAKNTGKNS